MLKNFQEKQILAIFKSEKQIKTKKKVLSSFRNYFFTRFEKWKAKNKKQKKVPLLILELFPLLPFSIFLPPPLFQFFPCHFFPVGQQKFPGQKSLGGTLPPSPSTCYATAQNF